VNQEAIGAAGEEPTESKKQRRVKVTKRAAGQMKRVSSQQEPANVPRPNCSPAKGTLVDALPRTNQPKILTSECSKHGQKNSKSNQKKEAKSAHTRHNGSVNERRQEEQPESSQTTKKRGELTGASERTAS
jgi:hypothetical protein